MANTFQANGFKLQPVLENFLRDQHFCDAAPGVGDDAYGGIIKSSLELVVSTVRFFGLNAPSQSTDLTGFYDLTGTVLNEIDNQGMHFFQHFDVAGYEAYHQSLTIGGRQEISVLHWQNGQRFFTLRWFL